MQVKFNSGWSYDLDDPKGASRRFNADWTGELDDDVAKSAIEAGVAGEVGKPAKSKKASGPATPAAPDYDAMSDEEIGKVVADRKLDVAKLKTRADVIAALKAGDSKK